MAESTATIGWDPTILIAGAGIAIDVNQNTKATTIRWNPTIGDAIKEPTLDKNVVTGLTSGSTVVTSLTKTTGNFLTGTSGNFISSLTSSDDGTGIEYISDVSLALSDNASTGAIEVVVSVQCSDGSVIEQTKYLSLVLTKKKLIVGTSSVNTASALTSVTESTTTLKAEAVAINVKQANCAALPAGSPYLSQQTAPQGSHYVGEEL